MAHHTHQHHHGSGNSHHDETGLADLLDLDAKVLTSYLDEVTEWASLHTAVVPRTIVDVGAGTGTGSLALARRFKAAEVVAIDQSALMLDRLRAVAREQQLTDRLRVVQADLDSAWPGIGAVDLAWAASSLHHVSDPDRVLGDLYEALNPGGLLVVTEMDGLPYFLPDDIGLGRPGLESRCHEAAAQAHWNAHPNWRAHLEQAGFAVAEERTFTVEASPAPPSAGRYAYAYLSRVRAAVGDQLAADDLATLDHLLVGDHPDALVHRRDLAVRGSRTAWAARRP
jgi:SAM-dependent methyltransferase